ncbi:hypothetical protein LTR56_012086 [Elasticomyces elasticus]|nr:hypothetical protein LTR56_012086 [Elasticomyces elasticus]KAK3651835.1 hypothetical protein LTR22_012005 [Elasticomyces elasticus]KAK4930192.1 hypothetical protein LTR49_003226 [Elasticomyces elasticus]KAK5761355.1 hypothetical protein LTS12_008459 [Elasticomyces elasticus]
MTTGPLVTTPPRTQDVDSISNSTGAMHTLCSPSLNQTPQSIDHFDISSDAALDTSHIDYTTFTSLQRRSLTLLVGLGCITSPLTATRYFPLLPLLRTHFKTTAQAINLTITIYIIFQALSPLLFGPSSDTLGRRPVYLLALCIYCAGNLGLAVNKDSFATLLVMRAFQSLGASAACAISYGIVADVCLPGERGKMLGPVNMALNLGTCVGPVAGGAVAYKSKSYELCFWILVGLGAILFVSNLLFLPETARSLVGNGSGRRVHSRYENVWTLLKLTLQHKAISSGTSIDEEGRSTPEPVKPDIRKVLRTSNPLRCLRILLYPDAALCLWVHGSFYVVDYSLVAAAPDIFKNTYHLNELQIGLTYLTRGVGIIAGSYCNGKAMDYNFRLTANLFGFAVDRVLGHELSKFPLEHARSRGSFWLLGVSTITLVAYGWTVTRHVHIAVPIFLQFVLGFVQTCFYTIYSTLLVDTFPEKPSTAAAAASVVRCTMAAISVAIMQLLLEAMGYGWYFTVLGLWSGICGSAAILLMRTKGMQWRVKRVNGERAAGR